MFKSCLVLSCVSLALLHAQSTDDSFSDDDFFVLFENDYNKSKKEKKSQKAVPVSSQDDEDAAAQKSLTNQRLAQTAPENNNHPYGMNHYMIYGDFLYWVPFCNDLTWGNLSTQAAGSNTKQYRFSFNWDAGFRVGFIFGTTWEDVVFDGNWTSFHNTSNRKKQNTGILNSSTSSNEVYNLQGNSNSIVGNTLPLGWKINAHYKLDFDQYDVIIKKKCHITDHYEIRPFIGARGLILNHSFTTNSYANTYNTVFTTTAPFDYSEIKQKNNSNAIGLVLGFENSFALGKGFTFFILGDVFAGYGKNNSYFWNFSNTGGTKSAVNYIYEQGNSMKSMIDVVGGFGWKKGLFKNAIDLLIAASYEFHYIFQNPTFLYGNPSPKNTINPTSYQDASKSCGFQGVTIRGGFGF